MTAVADNPQGPLVSVLIATYNRPRYLAEALTSLVRQTYGRFEAIIVNDGGCDVGETVRSFCDPRLIYVNRRDNRGKAASLNEALDRARGKYVAYLDDDDLYYPDHLRRLVDALEGDTDCRAAYTDLYKVHCRIMPDGSRQVLGKVVNVSRDFDRFFLCYFNHVLHVSLMHRRDLIDRTGPYNERLGVMIDWDMTRRMAFFTDFLHLPHITGEYYGPVGPSDRISYRMRLDKARYVEQVMTIRMSRPAKPWPKMPDLSIVYLPERLDESAAGVLRSIWAWTFMPYEVYLPLPATDLARLSTDVPNLVRVATRPGLSAADRLDKALEAVGGDYVAVVPSAADVGCLWVEDLLHAAMTDLSAATAFVGGGGPGGAETLVVRTERLREARRGAGGVPLRESLLAAGMTIREPTAAERAFQFDRLLQEAQAMEHEGNWAQAAWLYQQIAHRGMNSRWMTERAAAALHRHGRSDSKALQLCRRLNRDRPTPATLLLEARLLARAGRDRHAVQLLEKAESILAGTTGA